MTLIVDKVRTKLGEREVDFNLSAAAGEVHAILGKSGSGKSTLLNLMGGFLDPISGDISWNGESIIDQTPEQRPITTLFQSHNLFDHLSVKQNIAIGVSPNLKLNPTAWESVEQVLNDVGLGGRGDGRTSELSGGEQQRVGLARCLLRKRPVLLLDEPFGALDETTRDEMLTLTQSVIETLNLCVVMVTHNPDDAVKLNANVHHLVDGALDA